LLCDLLLLQWAQVLAAILSRDKMARSVDLIDADSEMPESVIKKVKFSHTRYRALGPELIPVYRQSARR